MPASFPPSPLTWLRRFPLPGRRGRRRGFRRRCSRAPPLIPATLDRLVTIATGLDAQRLDAQSLDAQSLDAGELPAVAADHGPRPALIRIATALDARSLDAQRLDAGELPAVAADVAALLSSPTPRRPSARSPPRSPLTWLRCFPLPGRRGRRR